jgi:hypothetical protein
MFSLRSKLALARIASAATLLLAVCAVLAFLPCAALAEPEGGEETPAPQFAFEPAAVDFGLQPANSYSAQTMVQLRNTGAAGAQVFSFDVSGPGSGAFRTGWTDCMARGVIGPGEACSVQVEFSPYDAVPFAAQLNAHSGEGSTFSAGLGGEGGRAILEPAVNPANFGSVPVGSAGVTKTLDVTNTGNLAGGAFIAVISGGAVGSFQLLDENCTGVLLTPAATCNLVVSFQPLSAGAKTARLSLFGEQEGGTQIVLSGVGVELGKPSPSGVAAEATAPKSRKSHRGHNRLRRHKALRRGLRSGLASRRAIG